MIRIQFPPAAPGAVGADHMAIVALVSPFFSLLTCQFHQVEQAAT
jgi:hypothetical protein